MTPGLPLRPARLRAGIGPIVLAAALLAGMPAGAQGTGAASRPLWELGLGAAVLQLPHYRGADQQHTWLLPVPFAVYRGDIFKADRDGARAVFFDSDRVEFGLSLAASAPTRSRDNRAREGMADLSPTVELGPRLDWTLQRGAGWKLDLRLPLRAVATLGRHPRAQGWIATPHLNLDFDDVAGWMLGLQGGPVFGSRDYHAYYYDVPAANASASRPAYRAPGGYAGLSAIAALSRRDGARWLGAFVRFDRLGGAVFADSPLVRQRQQWSGGVALTWVLRQSAVMVGEPR
jgi:outer membrane scaffolding protein for murein synthesis (MipA/OmpV family)